MSPSDRSNALPLFSRSSASTSRTILASLLSSRSTWTRRLKAEGVKPPAIRMRSRTVFSRPARRWRGAALRPRGPPACPPRGRRSCRRTAAACRRRSPPSGGSRTGRSSRRPGRRGGPRCGGATRCPSPRRPSTATCRAVWREETLYQPGRRTSPITETRIPFIWPSVTSEETSAIVETFDLEERLDLRERLAGHVEGAELGEEDLAVPVDRHPLDPLDAAPHLHDDLVAGADDVVGGGGHVFEGGGARVRGEQVVAEVRERPDLGVVQAGREEAADVGRGPPVVADRSPKTRPCRTRWPSGLRPAPFSSPASPRPSSSSAGGLAFCSGRASSAFCASGSGAPDWIARITSACCGVTPAGSVRPSARPREVAAAEGRGAQGARTPAPPRATAEQGRS